MRCRPVGDRYSIGRPPPWRPVAGGFHDVSTAGPRRTRRERDDRRLAGGRGDRGGRRPDRVGRARRRAADGHRDDPRGPRPRRRVAAAGLRRDAHPHALPGSPGLPRRSPGRSRSSDRSSERRRRCAPCCCPVRRPRATPAAGWTWPSRSGRRRWTVSSPGRACWWSGRRSRPRPGTTGSSVARPTRPTPSSPASARRRRPASTRSSSWPRAAATRRRPTRARSSTTPRPWPRRRPRRTGWGCRSWPTR